MASEKLKLKPRQRDILRALSDFGRPATTREIAEKVGLHVNGVSQSLGALHKHVVCLDRKGGDTKWRLLVTEKPKAKPTEEFLDDQEYEIMTKLLPKLLNTPLNVGVQVNESLERVHDDHEGTFKGRLQVFMSVDGDMWIKTTETHSGSGYLRFRGLNGGSMSPRIHNALRLLAVAIRLDNEARPVIYPQVAKPS